MYQKQTLCCLVVLRKESNVIVHINDTDIEMVHVSKCLGLRIDHELNCKKNTISMIKSKLSNTIEIMHKAKYVLLWKCSLNIVLFLIYALYFLLL